MTTPSTQDIGSGLEHVRVVKIGDATAVQLDGVDITKSLTGIEIRLSPHAIPQVTLHTAPGTVVFDDHAEVTASTPPAPENEEPRRA